MDARQLESLAVRLGQNAGDSEALQLAYAHGQTDPRGYAVFLEKAGASSTDPAYGAHWYLEAANVWTTSLSDLHRAVRALMNAVDKDPSHEIASGRLESIYREKNDLKGVIGLLERRIKALEKTLSNRPDLAPLLSSLCLEAARIHTDELAEPAKAVEDYKVAIKANPADAYSIYQVRELLKSLGRPAEALVYFESERALNPGDVARAIALYQDESEVALSGGNAEHATEALLKASELDGGTDPSLKQLLGTRVLERVQAGAKVSDAHLVAGAQAFTSLAETYDGEYGKSYALCALGIDPKNERAAQLAMYYAGQLGAETDAAAAIASYLEKNPGGLLVAEARALLLRVYVESGDASLLGALTPKDDAPAEERALGYSELGRTQLARGQKDAGLMSFTMALKADPANAEAVLALGNEYRTAKKFAELRTLLSNAAKIESAPVDDRVAWVSEIAELCEGPLNDPAGAIEARRQLVLLDPTDDEAADRLESTLRTARRTDELVELVERRAEVALDPLVKVARYRELVRLHLEERKAPLDAANALAKWVKLAPDEEEAALQATELYEKGGEHEKAIELLRGLMEEILGSETRVLYATRLGDLYAAKENHVGAGAAFAEAASNSGDAALWAKAERSFEKLEAWEQAAESAGQQVSLTDEAIERAKILRRQAGHLDKLGDTEKLILCLRESLELDPNDAVSFEKLDTLFSADKRHGELVQLLFLFAPHEANVEKRVELRKRAAKLSREELNDLEGMRQALTEVLEDRDDVECLDLLAKDAEDGGEITMALEYLRRLEKVCPPEMEAAVAKRLAFALIDDGDEEAAVERLVRVEELDPKDTHSLAKLAELHEKSGQLAKARAVAAKLVETSGSDEKIRYARKVAELSKSLGNDGETFEAYERVFALDPEDLEAVERLRDLARTLGRHEAFVKFQRALIEVEGDEDAALEMALEASDTLVEHLGKTDEALSLLEPFAKEGAETARKRYLALSDETDRGVAAARKLRAWLAEAPNGPKRGKGLLEVFSRLVSGNVADEAIEVGLELLRLKGIEESVAKTVEELAEKEKNLDALVVAYGVLGRELSGPARAEEMVRQAERLEALGQSVEEALLHGEQSLTSVAPADVERLLGRLARLAGEASLAIGVYERQVTRCKSPDDRQGAVCRAAEYALERGDGPRSSGFLRIAVQNAALGEPLDDLVERIVASEAKGAKGIVALFVDVLAESGAQSHDGGKSRAEYLARAALLSHAELGKKDDAYRYLTEALVAHVDEKRLAELLMLATKDGEPKKAISVLSDALAEVHDGPLVRQLLRKRYELLRAGGENEDAASADLKRLYELSPSDSEIATQLEAFYAERRDFRGLVQLFEDQILRSKDQNHRSGLARRVAVLWETELASAREAADAWRRVIRLAPQDEEAKQGLERAKNLQRREAAEETGKAAQLERARVEEEARKRAEEALEEKRAAEAKHAAEVAELKRKLAEAEENEEKEAARAEEKTASGAEGPHSTDAAPEAVTASDGKNEGETEEAKAPDEIAEKQPDEEPTLVDSRPPEPSAKALSSSETTPNEAGPERDEAEETVVENPLPVAVRAPSIPDDDEVVDAPEPEEDEADEADEADEETLDVEPVVPKEARPSTPPPLPPASSRSSSPPPLPGAAKPDGGKMPSLPPPLPQGGPKPSVPPTLPASAKSGEANVPPPVPAAAKAPLGPPSFPPVPGKGPLPPSPGGGGRLPAPPPPPSGPRGPLAPPPPAPLAGRPPMPPPPGASKMPLPPPPPPGKKPPPPPGKK